MEPKISGYTAKDSRPLSRVQESTGAQQGVEGEPPVGRQIRLGGRELRYVVHDLAGHDQDQTAAIAPIACSVKVETARPIAPREAIAAAT